MERRSRFRSDGPRDIGEATRAGAIGAILSSRSDRAAVVPLVPRGARPGRQTYGGQELLERSVRKSALLRTQRPSYKTIKGVISGTSAGKSGRTDEAAGAYLRGQRLLPKDRERRRRQRRGRRTMMREPDRPWTSCTDMRLSVMARAYRDQEELPAASADMSFDERLAMIVDAEWDSRTHQQAPSAPAAPGGLSPSRRRTSPMSATMTTENSTSAQIAELSNCSWIASRRNIIVTGASGAGKTWISNALGVAACNAFYTVRYTSACRSCWTSSPSSKTRNGSSSARTLHRSAIC